MLIAQTSLDSREVTRDEEGILFPSLIRSQKINVLLDKHDMEVRAGQDYFSALSFEIQLACVDLSSREEAATIRNSLVKEIVDAVRENPLYHGDLESSRTVEVDFNVASLEEGGFIAAATIGIISHVFENKV
jgi:hypothetical protein